MADSTRLNAGSGGELFVSEDVSVALDNSLKTAVAKIHTGALHTDGGPVTAANPFPVTVTNYASFPSGGSGGIVSVSNFPATQPVSLASSVAVTGTFFQATQPVSAATLPLPTGAATSAKQAALGTAGTPSADVLSMQGVASAYPVLTGAKTVRYDPSFSAVGGATPYAVGNIIASSGSAYIQIANFFPWAGASGFIVQAAITITATGKVMRARFHIFNSITGATLGADHGAYVSVAADCPKKCRSFDLPLTATPGGTSDVSQSADSTLRHPIAAASGSRDLFLQIETLDAVTLTAPTTITLSISAEVYPS